MRNRLCETFGIEAPIFTFSHCRDVVVEVSKAGGLGVLGLARMSAQRVDAELQWIDDHIGGRPYGIDILMPTTYQDAGEGEAKHDADRLLPAEHLAFVRGMRDRAGVPHSLRPRRRRSSATWSQPSTSRRGKAPR